MADASPNNASTTIPSSTANGTSLQTVKDTAVSSKLLSKPLPPFKIVDPFKLLQMVRQFIALYSASTKSALGPVAENVKDQASKTSNEFQNLANTRVPPEQPAATGQPLTHYHSMFYSLLSWENPRATGVAFASSVTFIFMARYLNILHYIFKFAYFILGVTATMEIAGKLVFNDGLASKMRPRKYWTIPKESLERSLDDVEQLLNFFVIEAQRIVYAENVYATIAVFAAALASYGLIKIVPFWGLTLIGTVVIYSVPLIYIQNREVIDSSMDHVANIVSTQAGQIREITAQHTAQVTETLKSKTGEYTSIAQDYIGTKKSEASDSVAASHNTARSGDFPAVPKQEPLLEPVDIKQEQEPLLSH